jgi:site-specific recombinase XerD
MALPTIEHPEQDNAKLKQKNVSLCALLDIQHPNRDKTFTIRIRIIHERKPNYYTTKVKVTKEQYKSINEEKTRGNNRKNKIVIHELLKKANDIILKMDSFSFENFEKKFLGKQGKLNNVQEAFSAHIEQLKANGQINTASTYTTASKQLEKYHSKELKFKDLTVQFLVGWENYMKQKKKSPTTISINTRCLRKLYNDAIKRGDASREQYPFGNDDEGLYQPPEAKNIKKALSKPDLKKIFEYKAEENSPEQLAKDIFIFSYLGNGMNLSDIFRLKYKNVTGDEIVFTRKKTGSKRKIKHIAVPIDNDMQQIIEKYGTKPIEPDKYIFNILTDDLNPEQETARIKQATKQTNKYLKRIAEKIGITGNISTYYARHSFASVLKLSGEDISYISEALGHSNLQTTENYLSSFDINKRRDSQKKLKIF